MAIVKNLTHAVRLGLIYGLSALAMAAAISPTSVSAQIGEAHRSPAVAECEPSLPDRAKLSRERLVLNGAPSALERIRNQQKIQDSGSEEGAKDAAAELPPSHFMRTLVNRPVVDMVAPASRTSLHLGEVRAAPQTADCAGIHAENLDHGLRRLYGDRPSAMESRLVAVGRTSFDADWARVSRAPSLLKMRLALAKAGVSDGMGHDEILVRVNRWVNDQIAYEADQRLYGQRDYWASAEETLARLKGDCEDYAILKMHMLRAAGMKADRMKFTLLRDLAANRDHAFLIVTGPSGDKILDNNINRVYAVHEAVAVRPILTFSENRRWVHAFRNQDLADAGASIARASQPMAF